MEFHKLLLAIVLVALVRSQEEGKLSAEVQEICDSFFDWRINSLPQFATFVGIHTNDDRLDDLSEAAYLQRFEKASEFLELAQDLRPTLTAEADIINIDVLIDGLQTFINGSSFNMIFMPLSNMEGPQSDLKNIFAWMPKEVYSDYEKINSRLEGISNQIDQMILLMKRGVETGITLHAVSLDNIDNEIQKFVVEQSEESPFYIYFNATFPDVVTQPEIDSLQEQARKIINEQITPAYARLRTYLADEYITRPDIAVSTITNGTELYNQLIWFHTSTNLSAQEIQNIGFAEVEEIEKEMMKIVLQNEPEGMSVQDYSELLKNDPNNYYDNSEDLIDGFKKMVHDLIPPRLPAIFKNIPKAEVEVVADPSESSPGAFYLAGSYDGKRPGVFSVNTFDVKSQAKYKMLTLSLHEANPGHHLQGSHSIESPTMPFFRRVSDDRNYGIAPSRFPFYSSYVEGWGLYSESLGFDMDLYDDPLERYGHYSDEIFRACRLVVDTGIHALGWTRQEAIDYMYNHTASSKFEIESEIDRYITWPGQALGYKIGELKFWEMRRLAEEKLGSAFDIKEFHEVILESYGPMTIVEVAVNKWLQDNLNRTGNNS